MYLVVGLGNPEEKYFKNFHNMGFMTIDRAAEKVGVKFKTKECSALVGTAFQGGEKIIFAKPQTFMNLSGESVKMLVKKYDVPMENLLIVYDDFDIKEGTIRLRPNGSAGTHNGMRNIVSELGETSFPRLRVGIGTELNGIPIINYVLCNVPKDKEKLFNSAIDKAADIIAGFVGGESVENLMQKANTL